MRWHQLTSPKERLEQAGMFREEKKGHAHADMVAYVPLFQYDTMKPDVFTEAAFKVFLNNLCPRPEIFEIFTS